MVDGSSKLELRKLAKYFGDVRAVDGIDLTIATGGKEARWGNVFITLNEPSGRYFLFNELGNLLIGNLTPSGFEEQARAHLLEPNGVDMRQRAIVWSHPAYADRKIFVRNDTEIICVDLAAK